MSETIIKAECVCCGNTQEIGAGDVAPGEQPCCRKCLGPIIALSAGEEN